MPTICVRTAMKSNSPIFVLSCLRPRAFTSWMAPSMCETHANAFICLAVMVYYVSQSWSLTHGTDRSPPQTNLASRWLPVSSQTSPFLDL